MFGLPWKGAGVGWKASAVFKLGEVAKEGLVLRSVTGAHRMGEGRAIAVHFQWVFQGTQGLRPERVSSSVPAKEGEFGDP